MHDVDLKTLSYSELLGTPREWSLDGLELGQVNLLVGKNATGKSRVINIITNLADQLQREQISVAGQVGVGGGNYTLGFLADGKRLDYTLKADNGAVIEERLSVDGVEKLVRDKDSLSLWYDYQKMFIEHQPSPTEISAAARKDKKQHPYLFLLDSWAQSVRCYRFGTELGKQSFAMFVEKPVIAPQLNDRNPDEVVAVFAKGKKDHPGYVESLLSDMHELGYPLSDIDVYLPENVLLSSKSSGVQLPGRLSAIGVVEDGIEGRYSQLEMSQGMFRALSVLVQVTYSQMAHRAHCILIDDIGEGLDFDRSSRLIEILRKKAIDSKFQLIMSTNDQYVMNHVPLGEWSVLQRRGPHVDVKNINNSRKAFEDFRFIGMSNFSFFEMDFANESEQGDRQLVFDGARNDA